MASRKTRVKRLERRFTVEGVRRDSPDIRKLGKALLAVVLAEQQQRESDNDSTEEGSIQ